MERVHAAKDEPADKIAGVAVSISDTRAHLGILHAVEEQQARLLHLALHDSFYNDTDLSLCAYWVTPDIEPEQHAAVAGFCRLVASRYAEGSFPYGFGSPEGFFGSEGEILPEGAKMGLTCATFVVAVFHRVGVPLLRCNTWRFREEDRPALLRLVELVRRHGAPPEHLERQAAAIERGQARFRPLEVAGAATSSDLPVDMETAERLADALAAELARLDAAAPQN
jgi:hypothetical protein